MAIKVRVLREGKKKTNEGYETLSPEDRERVLRVQQSRRDAHSAKFGQPSAEEAPVEIPDEVVQHYIEELVKIAQSPYSLPLSRRAMYAIRQEYPEIENHPEVMKAMSLHESKKQIDEAFGLGEMAVAVMVSFGGTRVEIDKNDMKAAEAMMQRIEKREEFSGVPSIDIRQEFDRMADEIRNNARAKVDDDGDGISDMEANFGVYDAADELATQIFLRADKQEAAKPKQEIPATQGIGAQSGEQKSLFQKLKGMVGMDGTKAPPAMKGKKTPSNQKQVRDAVKKANKKARKKMMDL